MWTTLPLKTGVMLEGMTHGGSCLVLVWDCHLPMQKLEKILPSRSSELNAPVISPSACWA